MPTGRRPGYQPRNTPAERRAFFDVERRLREVAATIDPLTSWPVGSIFISAVATNPADLLGGGTWVAFGTGRVLVAIDAGQTEFDTLLETGGSKTQTLVEANLPSHTHTITHTHAIDHDHGSSNTGNASVGHTHPIDHDHANVTSTANSVGHTHSIAHDHSLRDVRTTATGFGTSGDYAIASATGTLTTGEVTGAASPATSGGVSANHTHDVNLPAFTGDSGAQSATHTHAFDMPAFTGTSGAASAANTGATGSGTAHNNLQPYIVVHMWRRTA